MHMPFHAGSELGPSVELGAVAPGTQRFWVHCRVAFSTPCRRFATGEQPPIVMTVGDIVGKTR